MNNFGRVLKIAAQRRFALVGILASSLVIAVLWGANIGTLYPLVEVVFKGDSLPSYVASRIEASQVDLTEIDQQLDELSGSIALADDGDKLALQVELQALESRRALVSETHAWFIKVKPWVDRYAPEGPYQTLMLIVAMLVGGTALKLLALMANLLLVQYVAERTAFDLRSAFFRKSLSLDLDSFGENGSAELTSRLTNDVSHVSAG
ncbi:MAG: ABC transporter transmembrane domain-containing protein, partial [Rubripirellula sp.]